MGKVPEKWRLPPVPETIRDPGAREYLTRLAKRMDEILAEISSNINYNWDHRNDSL